MKQTDIDIETELNGDVDSAPEPPDEDEPSRSRGKNRIDVINTWCVLILIVSAVSVAGVVGAAVVTGEFDAEETAGERLQSETGDRILTETQPDGSTIVTWSDPGETRYLEIRSDDVIIGTLDYVGDDMTVESPSFEVIAVGEDGSRQTIEQRGM